MSAKKNLKDVCSEVKAAKKDASEIVQVRLALLTYNSEKVEALMKAYQNRYKRTISKEGTINWIVSEASSLIDKQISKFTK